MSRGCGSCGWTTTYRAMGSSVGRRAGLPVGAAQGHATARGGAHSTGRLRRSAPGGQAGHVATPTTPAVAGGGLRRRHDGRSHRVPNRLNSAVGNAGAVGAKLDPGSSSGGSARGLKYAAVSWDAVGKNMVPVEIAPPPDSTIGLTGRPSTRVRMRAVSYTHLRAHETRHD